MERRNHNRIPIKLKAIIHDNMSCAWDFVIENFAYDGLQLFQLDNKPVPDSFHINDLLTISFEIEQQGKKQSYMLEVRLLRVSADRIAVSLYNPALEAIAELSKEQQRNGLIDSALNANLSKHAQNILMSIKHSFLKKLSNAIEIFLPIAHEALFQQAQKSNNNNTQAIFFDSINTLDRSKQHLKEQFFHQMEKVLDSYGNNSALELNPFEDAEYELDLIDKNEFENWLAVNQLIIEVSPQYQRALWEIELRLANLFSIDVENLPGIPFSPHVIFSEFSHVIHQIFLKNDVLLTLYNEFKKVIENNLSDIYQEINQIFINNKILPVIDAPKYEIIREQAIVKKSETTAETPLNTTQNTTQKTKNPVNNFQHQTELASIENNVNLVPTYQTLKDLLTFQDGQGLSQKSSDFFSSKEYQKQLSDLINELTIIQKQQAKKIEEEGVDEFNLVDLVQVCMENNEYSIEIKNEFQYTLDIIRRLFDSIKQDNWLGNPVKKLLLQLQIPILKVAMRHKDFFESWSNPARMMVNKLAMVGLDDEKNQFYIKVRTFIIYLLKNYHEDLNLFSKLDQVLGELLDIQARHYNKKVTQIIKNWTAQQIVTNELASRLADRSIPLIIADFISYQWLSILVSTYLNKGQDSNQWRQYLQALDMLILSMNGDVSEDFIDNDVILFIIKQGLEENGQYNKKLLDDIHFFLTQKKTQNGICLNHDIIIKLLINGYVLSDKKALSNINKGITDASSQANRSIARRLKINDYLIFKQNNKNRRIQLIWQSDNQNVFVFAGKNGQQKAVFNQMEVVELIANGQLAQTKDYDLPLLERSLYAIMGNVHDDMAKQSNQDKLTGLIKKKEFIRIFAEILNNSKKTVNDCVLCLINIDQFDLINDTCGYEAGDQYIQQIAQLLRQQLDSDTIAGRYGTDEFILILAGYGTEKALKLSELLRKLIHDYHFKWEDKAFTLSASLGLISVNERNEPGVFLKAVTIAATIAKEMGRNRVHFLEHDALELNHRQDLQLWATKIDQMISNNQLDIRCQRIQPLRENVLVQHYEMLLLVKDGNGGYMPPGEFIEAAELYHKMNDVDRWVINKVFKWFSDNPEQLEIMGGIAINLSGQSLNDVDFLSFIKDIFTKYPEVSHEKICFEITETVAITNFNFANNIIHTIKEMGCEFSLDDFGTGQSSYAYLKTLPVNYLKIDGVFIKDIVANAADQAMVKSINEIGHFLGMKTIAEYVENDEIMTLLKDIGVDYAQGFGVEKPILISEYMQKSTFIPVLK